MKNLSHPFVAITCAFTLAALPAAFAGSGKEGKFKKMDSNGDGQLTREEHAAGAQGMFTAADTNSDGVLTAAELAVKHDSKADSTARETSSTRGNPSEDVRHAGDKLTQIDQDGDGKVTTSEHQAGTSAMFAKLDADGNGVVSQSEFEAGHKAHKKLK